MEFLHFLCFGEAEQTEAGGDALSFQLAQHDFAERHIVNWVPELAARVAELAPDSRYARLLAEMGKFVVQDFEWQRSTIDAAS